METEEVIKLVDGIYKNILEKFNPGARQLISAGKAYLKALHGASAASNLFNEALAKIAVNAQQGGTIDIGSALMNIVGVYKEIQDQHMNILKAFYVDLLVPLETNLEKDTKVVQFEQKKFLQQHKVRADSYGKAATIMKKHRKKNIKNTPKEAEKEIKSIQALEEEKHKLDSFCEQSLKNAMTQERRRYGFVLERQCSLAKHWMAYHTAGSLTIEKALENWNEVAATREFLPPNVENMFTTKHLKDDDDDDDAQSITSQLRKTRSIDASCLDMRSIGDVVNHSMQMPRAKSEFNLTNSNNHLSINKQDSATHWDRVIVKGLYAYLSSGENQLSFLEGDKIALVGDRAKGWQFGENLRTQKFGWFPIAYVENERDNQSVVNEWNKPNNNEVELENTPDTSLESTLVDDTHSKVNSYHEDASPTRMFGDTIQYRQSKQFRRVSRGEKPPKPGPPPTLPAPVPTPVVPPYSKQGISQSHSFSSSGGPPMVEKRKTASSTMNFNKPPPTSKPKSARNGITNASLHSSNDSGFSNEPPPQPEVDYSDEETVARIPIRPSRSEKSLDTTLIRNHREMHNGHDDDDIYGTIVPQRRSNNMRQANSFGNIADNTMDFPYRSNNDNENPKMIKRTKSFWRFSKSEDILEGMAMWKHNDIIPTEKEKRELEKKEATLKRNMKKKNMMKPKESPVKSELRTPRPQSIAVITDREKFPMTKSDIDKRISKHTDEFNGTSKRTSSSGQKQDQEMPRKSKTNGVKQDSNNNHRRNSFSDRENDDQIYGEAVPQTPKQKEKYRTSERSNDRDRDRERERDRDRERERNERNDRERDRDRNKNRNNDALNKYYQDQSFDDFSILNPDSIRMQDTSFYDDDSMQDVMLMKTVKRKEILKQYYSSGTDTERNSSSSDPYDCIVVDDHLVSAADMIIRTNRKEKNREMKNGQNNKKSEEKMNFSTFRNVNVDDEKDSDIEIPRTGTLLPRTKLSKANSVGPIMETVLKFESEQQEARENSKNRDRDREGKKKSTKSQNSGNSGAKAYGPWYDLWGKDSSVQK